MQTVDIFMSDVYQHNGLAVTHSPIIIIIIIIINKTTKNNK